MNTVKFTGKVSGEGFSHEFDNIQAYNEKVTELLKEGISFSASTSTEQFDPSPTHKVATPGFEVSGDKITSNYIDDESISEPLSDLEVLINEIMAPEALDAMHDMNTEDLETLAGNYKEIIQSINDDFTTTNTAIHNAEERIREYQDNIKDLENKIEGARKNINCLQKSKCIIELYKGLYTGLQAELDQRLNSTQQNSDQPTEDPTSVDQGLLKLFKAIFGE